MLNESVHHAYLPAADVVVDGGDPATETESRVFAGACTCARLHSCICTPSAGGGEVKTTPVKVKNCGAKKLKKKSKKAGKKPATLQKAIVNVSKLFFKLSCFGKPLRN